MRSQFAVVINVVALFYASSKAQDQSQQQEGLSQYWSDNFKDIHHIYGKTSDLGLYGETLPLSVTHGAIGKKKGKIVHTTKPQIDSAVSGTKQRNYEFTDNFPQILASQKRTQFNLSPKSTSYGHVFDPEDYKAYKAAIEVDATNEFSKQFKNLDSQQKLDFPQDGVTGFKPYGSVSYKNINNQQLLESYKSIQDIIDANDANREDALSVLDAEKPNKGYTKPYGHITKTKYEAIDSELPQRKKFKSHSKYLQGKLSVKIPNRNGCHSSRCRKRSVPLRLRKIRPRITKVKHRIVSVSD